MNDTHTHTHTHTRWRSAHLGTGMQPRRKQLSTIQLPHLHRRCRSTSSWSNESPSFHNNTRVSEEGIKEAEREQGASVCVCVCANIESDGWIRSLVNRENLGSSCPAVWWATLCLSTASPIILAQLSTHKTQRPAPFIPSAIPPSSKRNTSESRTGRSQQKQR